MDTRVAPVHVHDAQIEACLDGSLLVRNPEPLRSYPPRVTERLEYWAAQMPNRTFVAARSFNDIHHGVPLISRAVLVARLRELRRSEIEV
jgi:hypothetical protein